MSEEPQPWERLSEESASAYIAFCAYRDLDPKARSMRDAYRTRPGHDTATNIPGSWREWTQRFSWVDRVRAYDVHNERQARKLKEEQHTKDLEDYRNRQLALSRAGMGAAVKLLQTAVNRLNQLQTKDIKPGMLPAYFRAAAHLAEMAGDAEATALGLQELSALLEDKDGS